MSRSELMKNLQTVGLVIQDVHLFLDTHPKDTKALEYYNKCCDLYEEYSDEYEEKYGPLTAMATNDTTAWTWIDQPWPWQMEV